MVHPGQLLQTEFGGHTKLASLMSSYDVQCLQQLVGQLHK
jgi:hypothetical protein